MADGPIAIVGATGSGKSALAIAVARTIDGEIISMDSRQVYSGMDIGTAKVLPADRDGVPHHGLDLITPADRYSAGRFARDARGWMADIRDRGRIPVLAGGTGFFLSALMRPLFEEPALDRDARHRLKEHLDGMSLLALSEWADALDPDRGTRAVDRQRLSRVIEIALLTGRPLSWWHRHAPGGRPPVAPRVFVLDVPVDELNARIDARVDDMMERGFVAEVRDLLEAGYDEHDPGMNATGYIQMVAHLRGLKSLDETADLIRTATRQYARRQRTWLRNQLPGEAQWLDGTQSIEVLTDRVVSSGAEERA